ncbi:MAG: guanosine-3',5'-bis(diphosphate) 3'-pyrophosphohydrolase [Myxococcota bacterium]
MSSISDILQTIRTYSPDANVQPVMSAYLLAAKAHKGQTRKSGEAYLTHPLAVAGILAGMRMDIETIATALLHDALEDNPITKAEMEQEVGPVITELVDGVTKIGKLKFRSKEELQAENFRKMMLAMNKDLRVILVKLADRVHNMSTIEHHKPEKQRSIAKETMDIYVPIANRLGLTQLKDWLDDYCFQAVNPAERLAILGHLNAHQEDLDSYISKVCRLLEDVAREHEVTGSVSGRVKAAVSIFRKMERQGLSIDNLRDIIAFRVVVPDKGACYLLLGAMHSAFEPIPDTFKDYIARPKPNGYQSLHTTVIGPDGRQIEIQIRTEAMHSVAENGIAAHWKYKEGKLALSAEEVVKISRIREVFEVASGMDDATSFAEVVKSELYADEVFVFTPAGDVKKFPLGATSLDFAYAVHSDVGSSCVGAKVNGRMVPLRYAMASGDVIEILTSPSQRPNHDWLKIAKTARAISKIRRYLKAAEEEAGARLGRDMLDGELKRYGDSIAKAKAENRLREYLKKRGYREVEPLFVEIAQGRTNLTSLVKRLLPEGVWDAHKDQSIGITNRIMNRFRTKSESPVLISGEDGVLVQFAKCCAPLPGESVVGFITRGRGITVHKAGCSQLDGLNPDRRMPVEWDTAKETKHTGRLQVFCNDRPGLLASISKVCEKAGVNIISAEAKKLGDGQARCMLDVSVRDVGELDQMVRSISGIAGVESVDRVGAA